MKTLGYVLAILVAAPAVARADSNYVSLGIGTTATSDLGSWDGDGMAGSLFVGHRLGYFALEVGLTRYGIQSDGGSTWDNTSLGAAGGLHIPIGPLVGAFGRLGIEKTWMSANGGNSSFSGTGWFAGLGAELKLDMGFLSGALWAEYTRHDAQFVNDFASRDGNIDLVSLGITLGF